MPRKVKPRFCVFDDQQIVQWIEEPADVVAGMRDRAIGLMLRDMWVAAAGELAEELTRIGIAARLEALMDEVPLEPDEVEEILRQVGIEPKAATDRMVAHVRQLQGREQ